MLQFDGSSFSLFFTIPTPTVASSIRLHLREGNLIIHPHFPNGKHAFEYNGSVFTEIITPDEYYFTDSFCLLVVSEEDPGPLQYYLYIVIRINTF